MEKSKKSNSKSNFYLSLINFLKTSTNLQVIRKQLNISKQDLNYYIRELCNNGYIYKKSRGYYELTDRSKNITEYDILLKPDLIRGHAFVWQINFPQEIKDWNKRIDILNKKNIHYKLVGISKNIPRIKVLGRKIWLCNDSIRVFDKKESSYYGNDAVESRKQALLSSISIINGLENKLGIKINHLDVEVKKNHYALIKNDLAKECNKKGEIIRISDDSEEWLLVDDSLGKGGELENVGKNAFKTNIKMSKWWNEQKETNFEVTPKFILNSMNGIQQNQLIFADNMKSHIEAIQTLSSSVKLLQEEIFNLKEIIKNTK